MRKSRSMVGRIGLCLLCMVMLVSMVGCKQEVDPLAGWTPPSTTTPTNPYDPYARFVEEYLDETFSDRKFFQDMIASHFSEFGYTMSTRTLVGNTLAFGAWNPGSSVLSAMDDTVSFTGTKLGNFGISKIVDADPAWPLMIELSAEYDTEHYKVHVNAFEGNKSLGARVVANGPKQYSIDISAATSREIEIIISASCTKENMGQPITVSAVKVWQEEKKFSVVGGADKDEDTDSVEGTSLSSAPYYIAPNGSKYHLQVAADGSLAMVPVVPSKALFVGNELLTGFGFGMAASDSKHDYYYLVNQAILDRNAAYTASKLTGTGWEKATTTGEQEAFLQDTLLPHLDEDLELVVIQLGDNVNTDEKLAVFAEGSRRLLEFVRTQCPKARVVWVGAWYQTDEKQQQMEEACAKTGCTFVDIRHLATIENKNSVGNTYVDEEGNQQTITSAGVASHPNDAGFKAIANLILYKLGIVDVENYYA